MCSSMVKSYFFSMLEATCGVWKPLAECGSHLRIVEAPCGCGQRSALDAPTERDVLA